MRRVLFFILANFAFINGARILGVVLTPSFSHQITYRPLWKQLSSKGHQLVVLTTDPMNDPTLTNLTEIDLHFSYDIWTKYMGPSFNDPKQTKEMLDQLVETTNRLIDAQSSHPVVKNFLNNMEEHFDLAIVEIIMPFTAAFAERFKCPFIGIVPLEPPAYFYNLMGNHVHPILNPDVNLPYVGKLNFFERLQSVTSFVIMDRILRGYLVKQDSFIKKHFGNDFLSLTEISEKMSLLFVNANPILNQIRPLMPNIIQIGGGIHRSSTKPLPKELKSQLDNATQGFIYFSLGSNVKSKYLPDNVKDALIATFTDLPYKVLWKFELEELPKKPDNVIISKWFPQQDIFRHPNIKLFITQGGVQSIDEAIYDHIPMLGLPFYLDQVPNVKRMVDKGLGLSLDYKTLNKETFKETILELIDNPKYRNRVKELADLAQDQPMTGLEKAVWWTEYVIRHKGAKHFRSPVLDIPSYQYYLLDVIGFCVAVMAAVMYLAVLFFKLICRLIRKLFLRSKPTIKTN